MLVNVETNNYAYEIVKIAILQASWLANISQLALWAL